MRRALAAVAVATVAFTGCASSDQQSTAPEDTPSARASEPGPEESPSPDNSDDSSHSDDSGHDAHQTMEVEIEGDRVEPNGKRVQVAAGEPVMLRMKSDRPAELHIHSSPEQELAVRKGESTLEFTIDTPGVVDVEEHETGIVILQLEVS